MGVPKEHIADIKAIEEANQRKTIIISVVRQNGN